MDERGRADRILSVPFVSIMVSNGLLRLSTTMMLTLVPLYVLSMGLSPTAAGATTSLYMIGSVISRPLAGRLVDTVGRWAVVFTGVVVYTLATGLVLLTLPFWLFMLVRAVQGIGFGMNGTAAMTLATDLIPEHRMAQGIGYLGVEQMIVQTITPWLALEISAVFGFEWAFGIAFAFGAVNLLLRIPLGPAVRRVERERRERRQQDTPVAPKRWFQQIVVRAAVRPALVMFFVMFASTTTTTFLAAYAIERGIANAGLFFAVSAIMMGIARIVQGRLTGKRVDAWLIPGGIVLVAVALVVLFWLPGVWALPVAGALFGTGMGFINPGLNALAVLLTDTQQRGLANSTFFMAMDSANVIGGIGLGLVAGALGIGPAFLVAALMVLTGLVLFVFFRTLGGMRR